MTAHPKKNLAVSIHQRLLHNAKATHRPFQAVLQYFAMERFLYRLSVSPHADHFVLKGALLFHAWNAANRRPTLDIDLLAFMDNAPQSVATIVRELCTLSVEPDGLTFLPASVKAMKIKEGADYEGVRARFAGRLGRARIPMQLDVGFGDRIHPAARNLTYPSMLGLPAPTLRDYPPESVVAEKVEAMAYLGRLNSRMKDFYDIWLIARQFDLDGVDLTRAIGKTFSHRGTPLVGFTQMQTEILQNPNLKAQWKGFVTRSGGIAPSEFNALITALTQFLEAPLAALKDKVDFRSHWVAPGSWRKS